MRATDPAIIELVIFVATDPAIIVGLETAFNLLNAIYNMATTCTWG